MHETQKNYCFGADSGSCRFAVRLRGDRGRAAHAAAATECTCGGDASVCTCCGNCCASDSQPAQTASTPAEDADFDSRLAGSWTLVAEEIHGALGEIKNSSVPDGSNMYISLDGGGSGGTAGI